jgi:hypothetical protein
VSHGSRLGSSFRFLNQFFLKEFKMLMDIQNRFSNAQAITGSAGSTDIVDLGTDGRNIGVGEELYLVAIVTTAFTDSGSDSTVTVNLETDDNPSMSSPTTILNAGTFAALSAVGSRLIVRLPVAAYERYLGVRYTVANGNLTTGGITTFLTKNIDAYTNYQNNYQFTT